MKKAVMNATQKKKVKKMNRLTEKEVAQQYNRVAEDFDALCEKCRTYTNPELFAYCTIRFVVEKMLGFGASPAALEHLLTKSFRADVHQHKREEEGKC